MSEKKLTMRFILTFFTRAFFIHAFFIPAYKISVAHINASKALRAYKKISDYNNRCRPIFMVFNLTDQNAILNLNGIVNVSKTIEIFFRQLITLIKNSKNL